VSRDSHCGYACGQQTAPSAKLYFTRTLSVAYLYIPTVMLTSRGDHMTTDVPRKNIWPASDVIGAKSLLIKSLKGLKQNEQLSWAPGALSVNNPQKCATMSVRWAERNATHNAHRTGSVFCMVGANSATFGLHAGNMKFNT
jgi:hypothetical protein